jgi:capsular polysaccharide biosynthesis protein
MTEKSHGVMPQDPNARIFGLFSLSTLMRHRALIVLCMLVAVMLGAVVGLTRSPSYTTSARILIENRQLQVTNQQDVVITEAFMDGSRLQNQIEVLRSEDMLRRLYERVGPIEISPGLRSRLMVLLPQPHAVDEVPDVESTALDVLREGLAIHRIGNSHVVEISYTADNPAFAHRVVAELLDLYLSQAAQRASEAAQMASPWLRDRLSAIGPNAVMINEARPATRPDGPGVMRIIALSVLLGGLAGGGLAFLREFRDRRVRTCADAAALVGAPCLGAIPHGVDRDHVLRHVSLVRACMAIGDGVTGIASPTDGEGAEDMARDLADLMRDEAPDTVLLRVAPGAVDEGPHVLGIDPDAFPTRAVRARLAELRTRHSHVVVAFPALIPGVEVEAMRDKLDHFVVVVAWGHCTQDLVAEAASRAPDVVRGVLVTEVNLRRLRYYSATEHQLLRTTLSQGRTVAVDDLRNRLHGAPRAAIQGIGGAMDPAKPARGVGSLRQAAPRS